MSSVRTSSFIGRSPHSIPGARARRRNEIRPRPSPIRDRRPGPLAPFFAALKTALRDIREQRLRLVPVQPEDLPNQITDTLVPALEEDQNRRPRATQRAAEQSRRAQL